MSQVGFGSPDSNPPPRQKKPLTHRALFWAIVGCVFIAAILLGIVIGNFIDPKADTSMSKENPPIKATNYASSTSEIGITNVSLGETDFGNPAIVGTAENISGQDLLVVMITFSLYDSTGNKIGTATGVCSGLAAGEKWAFQCAILKKGMATYELADITAY